MGPVPAVSLTIDKSDITIKAAVLSVAFFAVHAGLLD